MTRFRLTGMIALSFLFVLMVSSAIFAADKVSIDTSTTADGYITVLYVGGKIPSPRMKAVIKLGSTEYTYDLNREGIDDSFPLQIGNGSYSIQVFENVTSNKYALIASKNFEVQVKNSLAPFLVSTQLINFKNANQSVQKSDELVANASDDIAKIAAIYEYITSTISYDNDKATAVINGTLAGGYIPSADDTLTSKKGICFDYSSLFATMLRAQGIPTRLVKGYVAPNSQYHAWNEVYLEGQGWVDIAKLNFPGKAWERMDSTFGASGSNSDATIALIGNGSNYQVSSIY